MKDFKIGDRVRYTDTRVGHVFSVNKIGKTGRIAALFSEDVRIKWDDQGEFDSRIYKYNLIPLNDKQATLRLIKKYL